MRSQSNNSSARESIFESIREHLAASLPLDVRESELKHGSDLRRVTSPPAVIVNDASSLVEIFRESLEAVDGHCIVAHNELEVVRALTDIIVQLRGTNLPTQRIAISDAAELEHLVKRTGIEFDEVAVTPSSADLFSFDVGISRAQAGIAETGTLLLDSSRERHRLVSLVPPVHIAIIDASRIVLTLGEALSMMQQGEQVSPIVTLVTGPSRTADIELTLAIGVHGPQELYVIVHQSSG
jgi:L-lactate utilization protein LutC